MKILTQSGLAGAIALSLAVSATAGITINLDFQGASGSMTGAAVTGSAGDYWNVFSTNPSAAPAGGALLTSGGGASGSLSYFAPDGATPFGFAANGSSNPLALMDGFAGNTNGGGGSSYAQIQFDFSGLAANSDYDVVAYGSYDTTGRGTHFFQSVGGPILGSTDGFSVDIADGVGKAYTTFTVTTDGSGAFSLLTNFNSSTSSAGPINGFQLTQVPEPATYALLLGLATLVAVRLRRR